MRGLHPRGRVSGRPGPSPGWGTLFRTDYYLSIGRIMTKRQPKKATKKPEKRGPKEERLIISEDPEIALATLLRPTSKKPR